MKTSNVSFFVVALALCGCAEVGNVFTSGAGGAGGGQGGGTSTGAQGGTGAGGSGGSTTGSGGATGTTSGTAQGGAGGTTMGTGGAGGSATTGGTGGQGGAMLPCGALGNDDDMDGFAETQGDCDDCDDMVSPAGAELLEDGVDNDCDGMTDGADPDVMPCDGAIAFDSTNTADAVAALDMCDKASDGTPRFVKSAKWVLADGSTPGAGVDLSKFHLGHGLLDHFGDNTLPKEGARMLALSSGTARNKDEPGFFSRNYNKEYSSNPPLTFNGESPTCPGVVVPKSSAQDAAGLELSIQAPPNARSLAFNSAYFTYDWPGAVCTGGVDSFWVNIDHGGAESGVLFDPNGGLVSANSIPFLVQCDCSPFGPGACLASPNPAPGQPQALYACKGVDALQGTDFGGNTNPAPLAGWTNGGTGWLRTTIPVTPDEFITVRFTVFDSGVSANGTKDHNNDSMALVDMLRWSGQSVTNQTVAE